MLPLCFSFNTKLPQTPPVTFHVPVHGSSGLTITPILGSIFQGIFCSMIIAATYRMD